MNKAARPNEMIVTLTINPAIDVSTSVDNVVPEHKLRCEEAERHPGGGGLNVSRAIERLGGESTALYTSGGATGKMLEELLDEEGIDRRAIPISQSVRESFTVLEEASGQQYRFSMPGPQLAEEEWQRCLQMVADFQPRPKFLVLSGSLPRNVPSDFYAQAMSMVAPDIKVIVDTSGESLKKAVDAGVYLLKPNLRELGQWFGKELESDEEEEEAARRIIDEGKAQVVVVSMGAAGALVVTKDGKKRLRSPMVPIRSKVGAGDSMVAGIVLSLARGETPERAAMFGVATGAAAVMTPGTELCRRDDAERLYRRIVEESAG